MEGLLSLQRRFKGYVVWILTFGDHKIADMDTQLNEAHEVLKNPELRAKYDRELGLWRDSRQPGGASNAQRKAQREQDSLDAWKAEEAELQQISLGLEIHSIREKELVQERDQFRGRMNERRETIAVLQDEVFDLRIEDVNDFVKQCSWSHWFALLLSAEAAEDRRRREDSVRAGRQERRGIKTRELEDAQNDLDELESVLEEKERDILYEHLRHGELLRRRMIVQEARRRRLLRELASWPPRSNPYSRKRPRTESYDREDVRPRKRRNWMEEDLFTGRFGDDYSDPYFTSSSGGFGDDDYLDPDFMSRVGRYTRSRRSSQSSTTAVWNGHAGKRRDEGV